jgi:hypothetical protein
LIRPVDCVTTHRLTKRGTPLHYSGILGSGAQSDGAELLSDNTLGAAGTLAANGYIALQGQDSNSDNQINSQDASYTQLRIWRDLNQDGISQAGELQTLQSAGIASIGVAGAASNVNLGNGNTRIRGRGWVRDSQGAASLGTTVRKSRVKSRAVKCYALRSWFRNISLGHRPRKHVDYIFTLSNCYLHMM